MVFPLIPIIAVGVGVAALVKGGSDTISAKKKKDQAKARLETANTVYQRKFETYKQHHSETEQQLRQLGRKRADGMKTTRKSIAFIQKAKLKNPGIISDAEIRMEDMAKLDQVYEDILKSLAGTGGSIAGGAGVGALTLIGAYGLVGAFGTASTGAAISGLSGVAATNATLAWFGGGALAAGGLGMTAGATVLGGIVAAPAVVAFGLFKKHEANKLEKAVAEKVQKLKLEGAKIDSESAKLSAVRQRISEVSKTITHLTTELRSALHIADPDKPEDVYRVAQLAKALRAALDEPVVKPQQRLSGQ